jgi:hypothetical protein
LKVADLDRDGMPDIILNGFWWAAPSDPRTQDFTEHLIDPVFYSQPESGLNNSVKVGVGDIDGDGIDDVVISPAEGEASYLAWYRCPVDPRTQPWVKHVIEEDYGNGHQAKLADFDRDGDLDFLVGKSFATQGVYLWLNDGAGASWTKQTLNPSGGLYSAVVGDIGADGDLDFVGPEFYSGTSIPLLYENLLTMMPNSAPLLNLLTPADGGTFSENQFITFTASASDAEDGDLSASIAWSSSLDGSIGTGASFVTDALSVGEHTITAAVTDSGGLPGSMAMGVTVINSGGDPEPLLTDNLVLRLESDLNVSLQSGSTVAAWLDQSGRGNDLVAAGDPQWVVAATPLGKPAIRLDGNGDKLERFHATDPLSGLPAGNANRTMFLVARYDAAAAWGGVSYGNTEANQAVGLIVKAPTGELVLQGFSSGNDLVSTTAGIGAGWLVQSAVLIGGTGTLYKDGQQIAQWAHTYNTVLFKLVIGEELRAKGYVTMDVAAVLIYDRALNESERAGVESYLRHKYFEEESGAPLAMAFSPPDETSEVAGPNVGNLELRILDSASGRIRLVYPDLKPVGNYHLHAVTSLADDIADPSNRIHTVTRAEIEAMSQWERETVYYVIPTDRGSVFFRLYFEAAP